ncbi:MAG: hypothetical protein KA059_02810 [Elusimicrobiales bacterium]|nr:hypothetical protein [Elusimicrobiales bacterium]
MKKNRIALSFGALCGGILALVIQYYVNFIPQYSKTLIIAFLPWIFAELFNYIYQKFIKKQ